MQTMNVRSWVRSCCLATLAAASVGVTSVGAQSGASEPEGMPVYRQKKSTFFQNPFSTTYQKLWSRAKGEAAPQTQQYQAGDMSHSTNAGYASDEGQIVGIEGDPTMTSASPSSTPKKRWNSPTAQITPGKSTEPLPYKPRKTTSKGTMQGQMRHTASKPTPQQMMMRRPNQPQAQMQPAAPGTGADRVIHVNDVNEGTPAIGSVAEVQLPDEILKSLAPGEKIEGVVKERIIEVRRDGHLVTATPGARTVAVPTSMPPAKQVPAVQQEVDPWFGDTVNAPSAEVQGIDTKEETIEALPPQSYMTEPVMPNLPPEEGTIYVEQTSFHAQPQQQVQRQSQPIKVAKTTFAAPPDGEAMQMVPAQQQMRRTATPTRMKQVSPDVLKKYQTNYRR